jgi:hypothetical protein
MRRYSTALLAAAALAVAACSDSTGGSTSAESAVQQAYLDADPGYFDDNPGGDSVLSTPPLAPAAPLLTSPGDPYVAPERWGRHRAAQRPSRDIVVVIEGDTARVGVAVHFRGVILVDTTFDGIPNPGAKPMREVLQHRAVFVRDDAAPHGWRLVAMTIGNIVDADPARRTVRITSLSVAVNGVEAGHIDDPGQLLRVDAGVPQLHVGDSVTVTASVVNTTGTDLVPPTQLFLHVRHARMDRDVWVRIPMQGNGDGTFTVGWTVRRTGIARMAVDALDSETLQTESGDNYRANIWAFPYRAVP